MQSNRSLCDILSTQAPCLTSIDLLSADDVGSHIGSNGKPRVAIITPTIARKHLRQCIQSVQAQTYSNIEHFLVVDGLEFQQPVEQMLATIECRSPVRLQVLPANTGRSRFNGYRICAAYALLAEADYIMFLDDDNWFDCNHVEAGVDAITTFDTKWAFFLRRICDETGRFIMNDDCDSLGFWRRAESYRGPADRLEQRYIDFYSLFPFHIDTNCYILDAPLLRSVAHLLLAHRKGDTFLANYLVRHVSGACVGVRSVNYRVRPADQIRLCDFFIRGNEPMMSRYGNEFPWLREQRCEALAGGL